MTLGGLTAPFVRDSDREIAGLSFPVATREMSPRVLRPGKGSPRNVAVNSTLRIRALTNASISRSRLRHCCRRQSFAQASNVFQQQRRNESSTPPPRKAPSNSRENIRCLACTLPSAVPSPPHRPARFERAHFPLRAIAIFPRSEDACVVISPGPFDLADPPQRLAQNLTLVLQLLLVRNVLVIASAAIAKMRAPRRDPLRRRLNNSFHPRANEFLLLLHRRTATRVPPAAQTAQTPSRLRDERGLLRLNQFFDRDVHGDRVGRS